MNFRLIILPLLPLLLSSTTVGDDDHTHETMFVRSGPVIERVPLKVIRPIDLVVNEFDETYVADEVGQSLFKVNSSGDVSLIAEKVSPLRRIAFSKSGGIYALQAAPGSSRILRFDSNGFQSSSVHLDYKPVGLAADRFGNLWTSEGQRGIVHRYAADEDAEHTSANLRGTVVDIVVNNTGNAVVLLATGRVVNVFIDGTTTTAGYLPGDTERIQLKPDGALVGLVTEESGTSILYRMGETRNQITKFGRCIRGTTSFAFDRLGNLTAGSSDLRAITKVTSHFELPCPHCGESVPMTFSKSAPGVQPKRHSF